MFRILLVHHQGVHSLVFYKTTLINVHLLVEILTTSINVIKVFYLPTDAQ
jgi:hypothetical protein